MADFSSENITKNYLTQDTKTLKVLGGIAHGVYNGSLALQLSKSPKTINVRGDIKTKRVRVFLPFAGSVANFEDIFNEYIKHGAIRTDGLNLGEQEIQLGYDAITIPVHWRPKIGEQLNAPQLIGIYKDYFVMSMIKHIDSNYLANLTKYIVEGVKLQGKDIKTQGKVRVLDVDDFKAGEDDTVEKIKNKAAKMLAKLRADFAEIIEYEDMISTKSWSPSELVIVARPSVINLIKNEIRYNIYNSYAAKKDGIGGIKLEDTISPVGDLDGVNIYMSKFLPPGVELILMVNGAAKEIFAMKKHSNFDKVPGVLAYKLSLEYQGGTGVFLPYLATIYTSKSEIVLSSVKYERDIDHKADTPGKWIEKEVKISAKNQNRLGFRKIDMEKQISPNFYIGIDENNFVDKPTTPPTGESSRKK